MRRLLHGAGSISAIILALIAGRPLLSISATAVPRIALAGTVTSREEGKMEGVVVNARRAGANFTVSVVTDAQGRYTFPQSHLDPGTYTVTIRAAGYELSGPATASVEANHTAALNLGLQKAKDLLPQLTSVEIAMSLPGDGNTIDRFVHQRLSCAYCHTYNRIVKSRHSADEWVSVINRMASYYPDGCASSDHGRGGCHKKGWSDRFAKESTWGLGAGLGQTARPGFDKVELGQFLATINLSGGKTQLPYELKTLPRPNGKATRVIITQYDFPRKNTVSHEMDLDSKGTVWYTDENEPFLGTLDPKTGMFSEYRVSSVAGVTDDILSLRDLTFDPNDNVWFPLRTANGDVLSKFDVKTKEVATVPDFRSGQFITNGDGSVWVAHGNQFTRINPTTMRVEARYDWTKAANRPEDACCSYQGGIDPRGNGYMGVANYVVVLDGKTGAMRFVPIPTKWSLPRRGRVDTQGHYWFAEYLGDRIGMYDGTDIVREWPVRKWSTPYVTSVPDRKGYVYAASNTAERVIRLDPKTGEVVEYLMPTQFDSKKIAVHPAKDHTEIWMSNTRNAQLVRLEPLD
jgi:streptogramin lyase